MITREDQKLIVTVSRIDLVKYEIVRQEFRGWVLTNCSGPMGKTLTFRRA